MNFDNGISIREFIDDEEYAEHQLNCAYEKGKMDAFDECIKILSEFGYMYSKRIIEQLKNQKKGEEGGKDGSKGIS